MRAGLVLAILIGTTAAALADSSPVLVIPGRPGVPVIINGVDASYAVVEGDWGLGKGVHVTPTVYGGRTIDPAPHVGHYYPSAGHQPGYGRLEIEPPAPQAAAAGGELSPVMVGAIHPAAGAARSAALSAANHRRAAERHAAGSRQPAAGLSAPKTREIAPLNPRQ